MQYNSFEGYQQVQTNNFGFISAAIAAGAAIFPSIMQLFGGGGSGEARGLAAIQAKTTEILSALDSIIAAIPTLQPAQISQAVSEAQKAVAALSNPAIIYQAKKGQDAAVLADAKAQASQKMQIIQAAASQAATQTQTSTSGQTQIVQLPTGEIVQIPINASDTIFGLDKNIVYLGAGALGVYFLLNRKK